MLYLPVPVVPIPVALTAFLLVTLPRLGVFLPVEPVELRRLAGVLRLFGLLALLCAPYLFGYVYPFGY